MIDYSAVYHYGVRVPDLYQAMSELGQALDVSWCEPQDIDQRFWLPASGMTNIRLRFTYSRQGPQRVELLEGAPGSILDGREHPGLHHVGIWCDDIAAETERVVAQGWCVELGQRGPDRGYGSLVYVRPPTGGLLVELVSSALRPMFERWFAGGPLA